MKPVWDKPNPVKKSQALTATQKSKARGRARAAGRPYPNMVDNIWAARNEELSNMNEAKATMCGRCGTKHVPPSKGGTCPALKEAIKDKYDEGEYNREGDMAKSDLRSIIDNAKRLHDMIRDGDNLPEWVQSKITLAEDYISTVANYMTAEVNEDIKEATSAAIRMHRALEKIKADRERRERLAEPYVKSVFARPAKDNTNKEQKPMKEHKALKDILEAAGSIHPDALHVKPVKANGGTKYQVHAVGKNFADGIKKGEHLSDTELDDATEMGARIKHIKEGSWFGNSVSKNKSNSVSVNNGSSEHKKLETRGERMKGEGAEESIDHKARFKALIDSSIQENEQKAAIAAIKKNIEGRFVSTDKDTDVIKDYDTDDLEKAAREKKSKHHHHTLKTFRAYKESVDVDEAITPRQALSKAADFEFKAANTNDPMAEKTLKGKAKALRRAAATAERAAGTVKVNISKQ